jgi:hypothetical protein
MPMSWNCEAITPTKMVRRTATEACSAPKKGISSSWVAWPMLGVWKGETRSVMVSKDQGVCGEREINGGRWEERDGWVGDKAALQR